MDGFFKKNEKSVRILSGDFLDCDGIRFHITWNKIRGRAGLLYFKQNQGQTSVSNCFCVRQILILFLADLETHSIVSGFLMEMLSCQMLFGNVTLVTGMTLME